MIEAQKRIVIIGSGLTGALLHHQLKKLVPDMRVAVWEKAMSVGGRYNTSLPSGAATSAPGSLTRAHVDLGAQYVTAFEPETHGHYYQELAKAGVLKEISHECIHGGRGAHADQTHFSIPAGMASIPAFFINGADVAFDRQLQKLSPEGDGWLLVDHNGEEEKADVVVLTCPIPEVLEVAGSAKASLEPYNADLAAVSYSSRFAMGVYYPPEAWAALDSLPWSGKYFTPADSDVIVWISIANLDAPRTAREQGPSVVVHTTVPYGIANGDTAHDVVHATVMEHLIKLVPELAGFKPVESELLYWKLSQIFKGYQHSSNSRPAALRVMEAPLLILAGDAFTKSGFDGCIDSAEAACDMITGTKPARAASAAGVADQTAKAAM